MAWNLLLILYIVSLVLCAVGFCKFVYFLSIGYGFAIAGCSIAIAIIFGKQLQLINILQILLFIIYGARLSGFLLVREIKNAAYRKTLSEATGNDKKMPIFVLICIWICVALLYVAQVSPVLYRLYNGCTDIIVPLIGVVFSICGLILETLADQQKSAQKAANPHMVATQGLYRIVRCPNYLGEIIFWLGVFVASFTALKGTGQWILAIAAFICIVFIMINGAQRLEKRQKGRYGNTPEYVKYADSTPILFPFIPLYHLIK